MKKQKCSTLYDYLTTNYMCFFRVNRGWGRASPPDSFHSIMAPNGPHNEEKFFTSFDLFYIAKLSTAPQESATLTSLRGSRSRHSLASSLAKRSVSRRVAFTCLKIIFHLPGGKVPFEALTNNFVCVVGKPLFEEYSKYV